MIVVSDTSPITYLIQVGKLSLLRELFTEVIVPPAVFKELNASIANQSSLTEFSNQTWIKIKIPTGTLPQSLRYNLDQGESEALALALDLKADYVIIDERRGAAVANDLHINTIGLIGVLTAAKKQGLISAVKPLLDEIITLGFYISERFYKKTLLQVNE